MYNSKELFHRKQHRAKIPSSFPFIYITLQFTCVMLIFDNIIRTHIIKCNGLKDEITDIL